MNSNTIEFQLYDRRSSVLTSLEKNISYNCFFTKEHTVIQNYNNTIIRQLLEKLDKAKKEEEKFDLRRLT